MGTVTKREKAARQPVMQPAEQMAEALSGPDNASGGVQSICRAFAILEEVARSKDGVGLSDLCRRVGLHSSTTFHLVKTMVSLGYIDQASETKRYHIGRPIYLLAAQSVGDSELARIATPVLSDISKILDQSVIFCTPATNDISILARTAGEGPFQVTDTVGRLRPLHATAAGKVILSELPAEQFDTYIKAVTREPYTPHTITRAAELRQEIHSVRKSGIGYEKEEYWKDVFAIAVGVHDFSARLVGAISTSAPVWKMSSDEVKLQIDILLENANRFSSQLGYDPKNHVGC